MTLQARAPRDMFIDGAWVPAGDGARIDVVDPGTEAVVDSVPRATSADLDLALRSAERGWRSWREVDAWTRSGLVRRVAEHLRERADAIAAVLTEEQGKPIGEAKAEVLASADQFDWYADEARRAYGRVIDGHSRSNRLLVWREAVGPVAAFTAWNFPALLPARKIAPALAAGCSIILKPAAEAPRTALSLAQACHDAGIPPGVVNVVTGDARLISRHLISSGTIRKVSLTGSVPVGKEILRLAADVVVPVTMELGGHAPLLVFDDADIELAAETACRAKFRNSGQVCISPSRFFVQRGVADAFTARFVELARRLRVGAGSDPRTEVGPLANRRRLDATQALVDDAVHHGAAILAGGQPPPGLSRGFYYEPTVLGGVNDSMEVMRTEPFAPIAPIAPFDSLADALGQANATPYGLAAYVFTRSSRVAFLAAEGLEAGMVGVNQMLIATAEAPFGGVKQSGFGREGGSEGIDGYLTTKYVNLRL